MTDNLLPQPLDTLMTQLGLSNADLVNASTEQLSFKNVQKGRLGKRLTPNIQDKILAALLKARPELKIRRRDLFRYEVDPGTATEIEDALRKAGQKKISYPQFIDRLAQIGVHRYAVDIAKNRITFYRAGGEAHIVPGPVSVEGAPGRADESALHSTLADARKGLVDHPTFLKRIYAAGISGYEVHVGDRVIRYQGETLKCREAIPASEPAAAVKASEAAAPAAKTEPVSEKPKASVKKPAKKKKPGIVRTTRKARLTLRKVKRKRKKR